MAGKTWANVDLERIEVMSVFESVCICLAVRGEGPSRKAPLIRLS